MAQSDYNVPNAAAPTVRAAINTIFGAVASTNSGTTAPATTFPHQLWYDTTANILRMRNAADSAWIDIGSFDQSEGTFTPFGIPQLAQGQVEDPASTAFGLVSGQRLSQAVVEFAPPVDEVDGIALRNRVQTELSASGTSWATITGLSDIRALTVVASLAGPDSTQLLMAFSTNNGSSWTSAFELARKPSGGETGYFCFVDLDRGLAVAAGADRGLRVKVADATYNALRFRSSSTELGAGVNVVPIIAQGRPT